MANKLTRWLKKHYATLLGIATILGIIVAIINIIKGVGFTLDIPKYYEYYVALPIKTQLYAMSFLNLVLTIVLFKIAITKIGSIRRR